MKKTIIAFAATVVVATAGCAQASREENIFSYPVGDCRIVLLSERQGEGNTGILLDAPAETTAPYLSEKGTYPTATNAFAIVSGNKVTLIDTGVGRALAENLATAGIEEIDAIYLTHMHGDHTGGLLRDGAKAFEGPDLSLSSLEAEYWSAREGDAKRILDLYRTRTVEPLALEDIPAGRDGIFPVKAYGHTPGHTAFLVVSGGERLLVWGDVTHAMAVQMPLPEISVRYDVDPDMARASRIKILEYVAANRIPVAGMHIPYPGIGTVERVGEGYKFTPVTEKP